MKFPLLKQLLGSLILSCAAAVVAAQPATYPSRNITIVVPFTAGTPPDVLAREVAAYMQKKFDQPVIVDNRPGAGTMLGSKHVADAAPDGYTLFFNGTSSMVAPETNPATRGKNYMRDASFISPVALSPNVIVVWGGLPVNSLRDYISYLKANPGTSNYATPGIGSGPHIQTEWMKMLTGTQILHVPYKSYDALYADLNTGRIQMTITGYGQVRPFVEAGTMKVLAVTTPERVPGLNFPTAVEAGIPGFSVVPWVGISGPKGMSAPVVALLDKTIQEAITQPSFIVRAQAQGLVPMPGNSIQFKTFVDRDLDSYVKVIRDAGIKIEQ